MEATKRNIEINVTKTFIDEMENSGNEIIMFVRWGVTKYVNYYNFGGPNQRCFENKEHPDYWLKRIAPLMKPEVKLTIDVRNDVFIKMAPIAEEMGVSMEELVIIAAMRYKMYCGAILGFADKIGIKTKEA